MMKIIVDKMPSSIFDCPYAKDLDGYSKCECTWNQCRKTCRDIKDCPFFTDKEIKIENFNNYVEVSDELKARLGDITVEEVKELIEELRCI